MANDYRIRRLDLTGTNPARIRKWIESPQGPPDATTRHVLVTLAHSWEGHFAPMIKMAELARRTALSERTVREHIRRARREGWLAVAHEKDGWRDMEVWRFNCPTAA